MNVIIEVLEEDRLTVSAVLARCARVARVARVALITLRASDTDPLDVHEDLVDLEGKLLQALRGMGEQAWEAEERH